MTITPVPCQFDLNHESQPRTPGVHVSSILRVIAQKVGKLRKDDEDEPLSIYPGLPQSAVNRVAAGRAWEDWLGPQLPGLYHCGELVRDGIIGTPDGLELDADCRLWVHEIKFTWKSSRHEIEKQWLWIKQLQCYCAMAGALGGYLWPYFAMGNYKGSGPQVETGYQFEFEQAELEAVWRMVLNYKDRIEEEA